MCVMQSRLAAIWPESVHIVAVQLYASMDFGNLANSDRHCSQACVA